MACNGNNRENVLPGCPCLEGFYENFPNNDRTTPEAFANCVACPYYCKNCLLNRQLTT